MAGAEEKPVRIRLGYQDVETFVQRFAANVTRGGVFIATKSPRHVGATFRFEIALAGGPVVLSGEGKVTWIRDFDPEQPRKPHGMGVQFLHVDEATFPILERLITEREGARQRRRSTLPTRSAIPLSRPVTLPASMSNLNGHDQQGGPAPVNGSLAGGPEIDGLANGLSEDSISRALEYARNLGTGGLEDFSSGTPSGPVTIDNALEGLSRMLRPRTKSGLYRIPPELQKTDEADENG